MLEMIQVVPLVGLGGFGLFLLMLLWMKRQSTGNGKGREISRLVYRGALLFLMREYLLLFFFASLVFVVLVFFLDLFTAVAFLGGALVTMFLGYIGIWVGTQFNVRTAYAADKFGAQRALNVAFLGSSVLGLCLSSVGLICLGVLFQIFGMESASVIGGFALGAALVALFSRVVGGIYTKCVDMSADLVGKVEIGIQEDDPRNPGVIADNIGDNVGGLAGLGTDLFGTYVGAVAAAVALGTTMKGTSNLWIFLPMALCVAGLLSSILGIVSVHVFRWLKPSLALRYVSYIAVSAFVVFSFLTIRWLFVDANESFWRNSHIWGNLGLFWAVVTGVLTGVLVDGFTEYHTSSRSIQKIAQASETGPATNLITGLAIGMQSTVLPLLAVASGMYLAYCFAEMYGIAIAAVGMLSSVGITMAVSGCSPIIDSASGIAEMAKLGSETRKITKSLGTLGSTTTSLGKGFVIGSGAITALSLFAAFTRTVNSIGGVELSFDLISPLVVVGFFLGGLTPFFFSSVILKAVGSSARALVNEIRRQFKDTEGLMEGKTPPDSRRCVVIATNSALKRIILPVVMMILLPFVVGSVLGPEALGAFLVCAILTGVVLGLMMFIGGTAWDNAKKWIEDGNLGGKGSESHKASIVGDTVGDPFKDASGPAMNVLIKLLAIVSLVLAPLIIKFHAWLMGH